MEVTSLLELGLRIAAVVQLGVAVLNLFLIRIMKWEPDLARAPLLIREVFHIHMHFISITLAIFGVLTWRFAGDFAAAANPVVVWLGVAIALFWGARSVMQWLHYSSEHWRGNATRTAIHWALFLGYGAMATTYAVAALGGFRS
jgi:energy-converting hydrogenase Eha subunit G